MSKLNSRIILLAILAFALAGCGTIETLRKQHPCNKIYSGTRGDLQPWAFWHGFFLDVPFSLVADTIVLPYTIPKTIINANAGCDDVKGRSSSKNVEGKSSVTVAPLPTPVAVYLIPLDDFPFELAGQLARKLSTDLRLNVRASLPMGTRDLAPLSGSTQYATEEIIEHAYQVGSRLSDKEDNSVLIALTTRDINGRSQQLRFLFSQNNKANRTSVISTSRMTYGTATSRATQEQIILRAYKMTKRAIGEQYFGLMRSSNISDIMYAPIMSLDDIDALGTEFNQELKNQNQ